MRHERDARAHISRSHCAVIEGGSLLSISSVSPTFVDAQPGRVCRLIKRAARETKDGLGGILLACHEDEPVELKEKNARDKTSALVAVNEGMVADDARRIEHRHLNHVRPAGIGMVLERASQSRLQKAFIAQSRAAAVGGQQPVVDREDIAPRNPDRFSSLHFSRYFARARRVLR